MKRIIGKYCYNVIWGLGLATEHQGSALTEKEHSMYVLFFLVFDDIYVG